MQELKDVVATAFEKIVESGVIEQAIEKKMVETITSIFNEQLRDYSEFGKKLTEKVKASLNVNMHDLAIPGYNDLVLKIIRRQVDAHTGHAIAEQIEKQMSNLLAPPPREIKLTELVADFIKKNTPDDDGCSCDDSPEEITFLFEDDGWFKYVRLDKNPNIDKYRCEIQLGLDKDGRIFSLKLDGKDSQHTLFIGPLYNFERSLFQMYAAGTKLVIDAAHSDIDISYPGRD